MWFSPQKWLLTIILLSIITLTVSNTKLKVNSKCGESFDQEEISPVCKPKLCGIRTWSLNNFEDILEEAKTLTNIIFDNESLDSG
jgi:hypothetical protein